MTPITPATSSATAQPVSELAAGLRAAALERAQELLSQVPVPDGCALAATGSLGRGDMTTYSDLDLLLLHPPQRQLGEDEVAALWRPLWEAKYHVDYAVRTPQDCATVTRSSISAGLAQLDMTAVAGDAALVSEALGYARTAWRRQLIGNFKAYIDTAISRWRQAGTVANMTNPEIKNGRGGLRDLQLLRSLALAHLADSPPLDAQRMLLLDIRTLLHHHARRRRDILDPVFAADIAADLGFADRYELSAALVSAASDIERSVSQALAQARAVIGSRGSGLSSRPGASRRPLDIDVVDAGGEIALARNPNLDDSGLVLRVAAASARTGLPVSPATWKQVSQCPPLPPRWKAAVVDDFFAVLSAPEHSHRVISELDSYGLWQPLVPEWGHIRGRLPRERSHAWAVDYHTIATVAGCARLRTTVARPDLLLLAALYHDMGKGYGRPHEQVGAQMVARAAARLGLGPTDRSRAQTLVAEHTTLAKLASRHDPGADSTRDALLDAVHYDQLTLSLLRVLAEADAQATGPGVWTPRLAAAQQLLARRAQDALAGLESVSPTRPFVGVPADPQQPISIRSIAEEEIIRVHWRGEHRQELLELLALCAAWNLSVVAAQVVRLADDGGYGARLDLRPAQQSFADSAADVEERFIQAWKSRTFSRLPEISPELSTVVLSGEGLLEIRSVERLGALGHGLAALPDIQWLRHEVVGATMIMTVKLQQAPVRESVVRGLTAALAGTSV